MSTTSSELIRAAREDLRHLELGANPWLDITLLERLLKGFELARRSFMSMTRGIWDAVG
jgi:hypothetical protein